MEVLSAGSKLDKMRPIFVKRLNHAKLCHAISKNLLGRKGNMHVKKHQKKQMITSTGRETPSDEQV